MYLSEMHDDLDERYGDLEERHYDLENRHYDLEERHEDLEDDYVDLLEEFKNTCGRSPSGSRRRSLSRPRGCSRPRSRGRSRSPSPRHRPQEHVVKGNCFTPLSGPPVEECKDAESENYSTGTQGSAGSWEREEADGALDGQV